MKEHSSSWGKIEKGLSVMATVGVSLLAPGVHAQEPTPQPTQMADVSTWIKDMFKSILVPPVSPKEEKEKPTESPSAKQMVSIPRESIASPALVPPAISSAPLSSKKEFPSSKRISLVEGERICKDAFISAGLTIEFAKEEGKRTLDPLYLDRLENVLKWREGESAYTIAQMYEKGTNGFAEDRYRAYQWYQISSFFGDAKGAVKASELANDLGRIGDAAHHEHKAFTLGGKTILPPRLSTREGY